MLIALIFSDLEKRILPDELTLGGALIGLAFAPFVPLHDESSMGLFWLLGLDLSGRVLSLCQAALGAAIPALFLWGGGWLYLKIRHREGLGFGDVKLMVMIGAFLGLQATLTTLLVGLALRLGDQSPLYLDREEGRLDLRTSVRHVPGRRGAGSRSRAYRQSDLVSRPRDRYPRRRHVFGGAAHSRLVCCGAPALAEACGRRSPPGDWSGLSGATVVRFVIAGLAFPACEKGRILPVQRRLCGPSREARWHAQKAI